MLQKSYEFALRGFVNFNPVDLDYTIGWEFAKLLRQICKIFVTFRCFYNTIIHGKWVIYYYYSSYHHLLMTCSSKNTFSLFNLKVLRPKVTKNITILLKKFCEFPPSIS